MVPKEELGRRAKDTITGFEGTVTTVTAYLDGTTQYLLVGEWKEGNTFPEKWVDFGRIEWLGPRAAAGFS